jgi:hypothetical protein
MNTILTQHWLLNRRHTLRGLGAGLFGCVLAGSVCVMLVGASAIEATDSLCLENDRLALSFDRRTGACTAIQGKLCGETYQVNDDEFAVETTEFRLKFADAKFTSLNLRREAMEANYEGSAVAVQISRTSHRHDHFAEKRVVLGFKRDGGLKHVGLSRPRLAAPGLEMVGYRWPYP